MPATAANELFPRLRRHWFHRALNLVKASVVQLPLLNDTGVLIIPGQETGNADSDDQILNR